MEQISRLRELSSPSSANLASVLRALNDLSGPISRPDIVNASKVKRDDVRSTLDYLESYRIVSRPSSRDEIYLLDRTKEFLVLSLEKRVSVSCDGHRSVRVTGSLLPVRDGSKVRLVGSTVWKGKMEAPRVRLGPVRRKSLVPNLANAGFGFAKIPSQNNDIRFQLIFDPPLSAGELIEYGFYVWNNNHYAKTRIDALKKFNDEWIREGLVVRDPTVRLDIEVKLPMGYGYQKARAVKNVVFSGDGTVVSQGETLTTSLREKSGKLELSINNPELGNYFLCWIPPERTQVASNNLPSRRILPA
jgi:hypothetical protein